MIQVLASDHVNHKCCCFQAGPRRLIEVGGVGGATQSEASQAVYQGPAHKSTNKQVPSPVKQELGWDENCTINADRVTDHRAAVSEGCGCHADAICLAQMHRHGLKHGLQLPLKHNET